jgi:Na+/alanine symporter
MDDVLYYPILIIVLLAAGLFFTVRTRLIQFRVVPGMHPRRDAENPAKRGLFLRSRP